LAVHAKTLAFIFLDMPVRAKNDGLPHGPSSSGVCCVVEGCFHDVVVMCSEFISQQV